MGVRETERDARVEALEEGGEELDLLLAGVGVPVGDTDALGEALGEDLREGL